MMRSIRLALLLAWWVGQLGLALDIDHLALAETDPCGDPAGLAKGEAADLQHRQPVQLPDRLAVGVDQHGAARDLFVPDDPRHDHTWTHFLGVQAEWWFNSASLRR